MDQHDTDHDLTDQFATIVAGQGLDLERLAAVSRRDGTRLRTRRRLATGAASLAVVAVVGSGALLLPYDGGSTPPVATGPTPSDTPSTSASPTASPTAAASQPDDAPDGRRVALTGRSTAFGLFDLVSTHATGEATRFAGQGRAPADGKVDPAGQTFARFTWTPSSGGTGTPVMINVQNAFGPDEVDQSGHLFFSCRDDRVRCRVDRQGEMTVVSYEVENGDAVDRHVDVFHRDTQLRVVVGSTNASDFEKTDAAVRPAPPLSFAVLRAVATSDEWGPTVPRSWAQAGADLAGYDDLDTDPVSPTPTR